MPLPNSFTNRSTAIQLESRLEEIVGAIDEYEDYIDLPAVEILVAKLEELVEAAGEAQESDHEDDETTEDSQSKDEDEG